MELNESLASPTGNSSTDIPAVDAAARLLDMFLPGFGPVRHIVRDTAGFDITMLVMTCFAIGAGAGAWTFLWVRCRNAILDLTSSSISIESTSRLFETVLDHLAKTAVPQDARRLAAEHDHGAWGEMDASFFSDQSLTKGSFNFEDFEAKIQPKYIPANNHRHYFRFQGHLLWIIRGHRHLAPESHSWSGYSQTQEREYVIISCFGWNAKPIKDYLMECKTSNRGLNSSTTVVSRPQVMSSYNGWTSTLKRARRQMDTVYLDEDVKESLIKDAAEFLRPTTVTYYAERGIPYRRGYLFHGSPGTGKTSLCFALAGYFGLRICVLSLVDPAMTDQILLSLMTRLPMRCIVLLEDIDAAGLSRKQVKLDEEQDKTKQEQIDDLKSQLSQTKKAAKRQSSGTKTSGESSVTLSGLLNALDGVAVPEGRILIMTTNAPETLDEALVRPGRVDRRVHFCKATNQICKLIFARMFQGCGVSPESLDAMSLDFAEHVPEDTFSPAEIQGFLLTHRQSPTEALEDIGPWCDEQLAARAALAAAAAEAASRESEGKTAAGAESDTKSENSGEFVNDCAL